jgi:hypothetical protein
VTRLDAGGITLAGYRLGQQISCLNHDFLPIEGGTQYVSTLTIGTSVPLLRSALNPLIHRAVFTRR